MASKSEKLFRCAIYTRKSTEHGLELEFNSLDAQREACEAYVKSQTHEGWKILPKRYDDPAYSGGNLDRPALQKLLHDIDAELIDVVVSTRSPPDPFAGGFCQARRSVRQKNDFVCGRHPAI